MQTTTIIPFEKTEERLYFLAYCKKQRGETEGSLKYLLELVDRNTDDFEVYAMMGSCYFDLGLYVLSLNAWFRFLSASPKYEHARAFNAIGACYHKMDEYGLAAKYFEEQIVLANDKEFEYDDVMMDNYDSISDATDPDFYICYPESRVPSYKKIQQAEILANRELYGKAIEILESIPENSEDYSRTTLLKACYYYFSGEQNKAVDILDDRILQAPDDKNAVVNVISMLISLDRNNELDKYFELLKNIEFNSSGDCLRVALSCIEGNREDLALFFAKKSVELNRYNTGALHILGLLYYNAKNFSEAMKCFRLHYNLTRSQIAEYYLMLASKTQDGSATFKKLKYVSNVPDGVKRDWMKYVRNIIGGGKIAYAKCDKKKLFYILKWLYTFPNSLQNDIMFVLFEFSTPKIRAFYLELLLDATVSDLLKSKLITLLCYTGYKKRFSFVIGGQFNKLKISPARFKGENAELFFFAYSFIVGCLSFVMDDNTDREREVCEQIYSQLTGSGDIDKFSDVNALSCAISTKLSFDGSYDLNLLIKLFDADESVTKKYIEIINGSAASANTKSRENIDNL
ncbi:MAG: tetratricopeptide repeat protein [Christensenellaceae bacterium]